MGNRPAVLKGKWILFGTLLAVAVFMYVSITWKIVHYGP